MHSERAANFSSTKLDRKVYFGHLCTCVLDDLFMPRGSPKHKQDTTDGGRWRVLYRYFGSIWFFGCFILFPCRQWWMVIDGFDSIVDRLGVVVMILVWIIHNFLVSFKKKNVYLLNYDYLFNIFLKSCFR